MTGYCFKMETLGAVDGPGLRLVLFLQGCPLRCPYCHNPEGWAITGGEPVAVEEIIAKLRRYRGYYRNGGITVSGGEPLLQADFVRELFIRCREEGFHTALDPSGCVEGEKALAACREADLLLLDIKTANSKLHEEQFGFPLNRAERLLALCEEWEKPVWIRHVIAPGLTDSLEGIDMLAEFLRGLACVKRIELLPFRNLCLEKYEHLGIPFPMGNNASLSDEDIVHIALRLRSALPDIPVFPA